VLTERVTDPDGRIADLATELIVGNHRLIFDTDIYLAGRTFYPEVAISFKVTDPSGHYHVPLLLSPFAYSTYRGS
jgi:5-hydroxyisourate hydrolase